MIIINVLNVPINALQQRRLGEIEMIKTNDEIQGEFDRVIKSICKGMPQKEKDKIYPYIHKAWFDGYKKGIDAVGVIINGSC